MFVCFRSIIELKKKNHGLYFCYSQYKQLLFTLIGIFDVQESKI